MDLLPPSATPQERALANATARVGAVPVLISDIWNPEKCPVSVLPWLAWAMSVDSWDSDWSEEQQRAVIAASVDVHRHKGTIGGLKRALRPLGFGVEVKEQAVGPYTFSMMVDFENEPVDLDTVDRAEAIALQVKNVRSWLYRVGFLRKSTLGMWFACAGILGDAATVFPYVVLDRDSATGQIRIAFSFNCTDAVSVYPDQSPKRVLEDGSYRLTESGSKRLLET